jgi:hypothetical protein
MPSVKAAFARLNLGGSTPTAPLFVYHAIHDELIPISGVNSTVAKYCLHRDAVSYTRDSLSEHVTLAFTGASSALSWLQDRLTGGAVPHACTTRTVLSMALTPTGLTSTAHLLLEAALALLDQPIGEF